MFKGLKSLFYYQKPNSYEHGFEFPESEEESADWDQYIGNNRKNKQDRRDSRNNQNSQDHNNQDNHQNSKQKNSRKTNANNDEDQESVVQQQFDVYNRLMKIMQYSQQQELSPNNPVQQDISSKKKKEGNGEGKESKKTDDHGNDSRIKSQYPNIVFPVPLGKMTRTNNREKSRKKKGNSDNEKHNADLKCVSASLDENIRFLKKFYHIPPNMDFVIREFNIARKIPAFVIYVDGMIDRTAINEFILPELMYIPAPDDLKEGCVLDYVEKNIISLNQVVRISKYKEINQQILSGLTALFIDGCDECLVIESRGFDKREVGLTVTETVIKGSQEGFTEAIRTNITLVRRILKNENLINEFKFISKTNNFLCAILYIDGITNPRLVDEVRRRIENLDIDYISGSGMLEQLIEDSPKMLFPQIISTERPDRIASFLMDGKVAVICEGTPFALAMPVTFFDLFHSSEEANLRWQYGSFLRIIRLLGILIAALLPGMYTAAILFHQEMIPTALLFSIVASRAAVPFPTIMEIVLMELSFELIREGGIRVPGITGNTLGIIGALIMGQAAVAAGLVSPILIIIVAASGLGSFAIPNYELSLAVRIIRFMFIIFAFFAGFYGISVGFTILISITLGMKSFGVPFFSPVAPKTKSNNDRILRGPLHDQQERLDYLNPLDTKSMAKEPRKWTTSLKGGGR